MFLLWTRNDLHRESVEGFLSKASEGNRLSASALIELVDILARRPELQELAGRTASKAKQSIETENDVAARASLYAQLARAILPASSAESSAYFRGGLEQMDAVGSGDYQLTHELLWFAATLRGPELEDKVGHTLTNICELNMPDEAEKFGWSAFGSALSKALGYRGLAKLGRWDDRSKVSL